MSYPSIYKAKAVSLTGPTLTAYVPAVFGDVAIQITDFLSTPVPGMGWVMFQAGDCEFPVWVGNDVAVGGGH